MKGVESVPENRARLPWGVPHEAMQYAGYRALREAAERCADRPVSAALGMYLFSHAVWLAREMRCGGFERMVFLARDGCWVKQAYDLVAPALGVHVPSDYVRISRQAAFPLHFHTAEDLSSLPEWVSLNAHSPQTLTALLAPVLRIVETEQAVEAAGLRWQERLSPENVSKLLAVYAALWDADAAAVYREHARAYFATIFQGKCATFDVGYNLRSEFVIRDVTGADVTAFMTHTDSDVPDRRGVPYRTLYGASPFVSWVAREQFLLEEAPMCIGYDADGPVLAAACEPVHPAVRRCRQEALTFVEHMVCTYGERLKDMPFRPCDGCAAFEQFLHRGPHRLMKPFRHSALENAFHAGAGREDGVFLQWRLMQTDACLAMGAPRWLVRLRRALIRLREDPRSLLHRR